MESIYLINKFLRINRYRRRHFSEVALCAALMTDWLLNKTPVVRSFIKCVWRSILSILNLINSIQVLRKSSYGLFEE
uniref:Uncharacterized protein n=1 Tax=Tetranychus urticae TaxID=32264 RepID=T1JUI0_TETUR